MGEHGQHRRRRCGRRGQSLVIALSLVLLLTMLVTATQLQVLTQMTRSKSIRDYERALQMAEAGANAYLNVLSNGSATGSASAILPPLAPTNAPANILSLTDFKAGVLNGTYKLVWYPQPTTGANPAYGKQQGYFVYQISGGTGISFVSYGWSNGIVRRIRLAVRSMAVFDWAAVYGLNPDPNSVAWNITGSASIVGSAGSEGVIQGRNNVSFYDGPLILAGTGVSLNSTFNPTISQSQPNLPSGHSGYGTVASPSILRYSRSLDVETVDAAANDWALQKFGATTTSGTEYFRTHNDNATGLRYLVKDNNTKKIRELNDPKKAYSVVPTTGNGAWDLAWPTNSTLTAAGMGKNENFVGIRAYPGTYFFEKISQQTSNALYLRTYADGETPSGAPFTVYSDNGNSANPPNPNSGQSTEREVRFWVGNPSSGNSPNSSLSDQTIMEDDTLASRFRLYLATRGTTTISGTNSNPPRLFRVNLLAYNSYVPTSGQTAGQTVYYGNVSLASGTYLFGSLVGWQINVSGGCTIEKESTQNKNGNTGNGSGGSGGSGGGTDRLTYVVTDWKELS